MFISTVEELPDDLALRVLFNAIEVTNAIKICRSTLGDAFRQSEDEERQKAMDRLARIASQHMTPDGDQANAVIGARLSTTTAELKDGMYMMMTWYGTPAFVYDRNPQ